MLYIYIDGSCRGNGYENSKGGFGIVIFDNNRNLIDAYC
jgi:ribonuclease HI